MKFQNPANNYVESSSSPWLWTLLFGFFYFLFKGIWVHAVLSFCLAGITFGFSWLIYPFFSGKIIENYYLRKGWMRLD
jgi:hypothetical protein